MDARKLYANLLEDATKNHGLVLERKDKTWYWIVLGWLVTIISFGQVDFMNQFYSVIGNRVGIHRGWHELPASVKYEVLLHEMVHIKQFKRAGFGNVWLGTVLLGFAYLFLPLPIGLSWCRAKMEMEGYEASIRAIIQTRGVVAAKYAKPYIVRQFTTVNYLWMWPFRKQVERWYDEAVERIYEEERQLRLTLT